LQSKTSGASTTQYRFDGQHRLIGVTLPDGTSITTQPYAQVVAEYDDNGHATRVRHQTANLANFAARLPSKSTT